MLMRTDPFRDLDRLTEAMLGTRARPTMMPMDAYREDGTFVVHLDLPGVTTESIDLTVERSYGVFSRQMFLGDTLDADRLEADYDAGVLTIKIPIAEKAKPRRIEVNGGADQRLKATAREA